MSRQAFEAHILRTTPTAELDMNNGEYIVQSIQYQWLGWRACMKELSEREPDAWILPTIPVRIVDHPNFNANYGGTVTPLIIRPTEES